MHRIVESLYCTAETNVTLCKNDNKIILEVKTIMAKHRFLILSWNFEI